MKTSFDPRHIRRRKIIEILFSNSFLKQGSRIKTAQAILKILPEVDNVIQKIAPEFPIDKINKIDLAILRMAVFELSFEKKEPPKVVIDEAVELAKELGGESSPGFINGALGNLVETPTS